jgi:hypothetical protein
MPGLMSGDWKRGTVSGPQRLQRDAWTAPDLTATAPAPDSTRRQSLLRSQARCALLIWKGPVKERDGFMSMAAGLSVWVDGAARGRGQDVATVITLICAGQLSRSRMTVSRHRGVLRTSGRGSVPQRSARGFSAISASPERGTLSARGRAPEGTGRGGSRVARSECSRSCKSRSFSCSPSTMRTAPMFPEAKASFESSFIRRSVCRRSKSTASITTSRHTCRSAISLDLNMLATPVRTPA